MFTLLEICESMPEMDAYAYFRWRLNRWRLEFYRTRRGMFQFSVDLPLVHVCNTLYQETYNPTMNPDNWDKDPSSLTIKTRSVVSGKVFWWKIKI